MAQHRRKQAGPSGCLVMVILGGGVLMFTLGAPIFGFFGMTTFDSTRVAVAGATCRLSGASVWPLQGEITSPFGYRLRPEDKPEAADSEFHTGVDIAGDTGTPVKAAASGTVLFAGDSGNYGLMVKLQHDAESNAETWYGHLSELKVTAGDHVGVGDTIGLVGSTGRTTGPHLHFEYRLDGTPVDPQTRLCADHGNAGGALTPEQFVKKLRPFADQAADQLGVSRSYATFFLVHWAQESGFESPEWIGHHGAQFNYAGIKGSGPFRSYGSISAFVTDYVDVLATTTVANGKAYAQVIQLMRDGAPVDQVMDAMGASPWDQDHYGRADGLLDGTLLHRRYQEMAPWL